MKILAILVAAVILSACSNQLESPYEREARLTKNPDSCSGILIHRHGTLSKQTLCAVREGVTLR